MPASSEKIRDQNLRLAAFLLVAVALLAQVAVVAYTSAHASFQDFRTFYSAGWMVRHREGRLLYDYDSEKQAQDAAVTPAVRALPFMNPAYAALPFVPLAWTVYRTAYWIFMAWNLALLALAAWLLRAQLGSVAALWKPLPWLLFAGFFPVGLALGQGQMSLLLLAIFAGAQRMLAGGRILTAGLLLSLALMKFQIALPVALLFLLWRQWRFLAGFVVGACSPAAASVAVAGVPGSIAWCHSLVSMSSKLGAEAAQLKYAMFPSEMPNLYGLIFETCGGKPAVPWITVLATCAVLAWAAMRRPSLPLAVVVALLVSYHLYLHDFALLLMPICLTVQDTLQRAAEGEPPAGRALWAIAISVVLLFSPLYIVAMRYNAVFLFALPIVLLFFCCEEPTGTRRAASELE